MRRRTLATIVVSALAALSIACGSSTTGSPEKAAEAAPVTTVKVGETMSLAEGLFGSADTAANITVGNPRVLKPKNSFDKPDRGQYFAVDVAVQVTKGKFSLSWSSFKLVAADGTVYDAAFQTDAPLLDANDITVGQKSSGTVVFDAAAGAQTGGKVALKRLFESADAGYWTL